MKREIVADTHQIENSAALLSKCATYNVNQFVGNMLAHDFRTHASIVIDRVIRH